MPDRQAVPSGAILETPPASFALREPRADLAPHPDLPSDTRLWAALVQASGGVCGGCLYDPDAIITRLTSSSKDTL